MPGLQMKINHFEAYIHFKGLVVKRGRPLNWIPLTLIKNGELEI